MLTGSPSPNLPKRFTRRPIDSLNNKCDSTCWTVASNSLSIRSARSWEPSSFFIASPSHVIGQPWPPCGYPKVAPCRKFSLLRNVGESFTPQNNCMGELPCKRSFLQCFLIVLVLLLDATGHERVRVRVRVRVRKPRNLDSTEQPH